MPTRRGALAVAFAAGLAVSGAVYGVEEFVLLALALAAALLVGLAGIALTIPGVRRALRVEVLRPERELHVGDLSTLTVAVSDVGPRRLSDLWLERQGGWDVSLPGLDPEALLGASPPARRRRFGSIASAVGRVVSSPEHRRVALAPLDPGGRVVTTVTVPTERRGLWSLAPRRVWITDPLGLVLVCVARSPGAHLVVCPRPAPPSTPTAPAGLGAPDVTIEAHGHTRAGRGGGDELTGLRPYVPGDRLVRLHWPALARTGDLLVREFVEPEAPCVEVFVDDRPVLVEGAVANAAGVGVAALEAGSTVTLVTGSGDRLSVAPGPGARRTLLEALAVVAPSARWSS